MSDPRFKEVQRSHQHQPKHVRPTTLLQTPGVALKWHLVYPESLPIKRG